MIGLEKLLVLLSFVLLPLQTQQMETETPFRKFAWSFLRTYAHFHPESAFRFGWREYAGLISDVSPSQTKAYRYFLLRSKAQLKNEFHFENSTQQAKLSQEDFVDHEVLALKIESELFHLDVKHDPETNINNYLSHADIYEFLLKKYAPVEQRLQDMAFYLSQLPQFYEQAKSNIQLGATMTTNSTATYPKISKEILKEAKPMGEGFLQVLEQLENEISSVLKEEHYQDDWDGLPSDVRTSVLEAKAAAIRGLGEFIRFLNEEVYPHATGSFRLGKAVFEQMLRTEGVNISLEKLLQLNQANMERNLQEVKDLAKQIDPAASMEDVMQKIRENHPKGEDLVEEITNVLEELRTFLVQSEFVSIPSEDRPTVMITPKPYREWIFAACDSPGPLDEKVRDGYYWVTPPEPTWSVKEQKEWLGTLNYEALYDISVHECWPGHYLHLLHNQKRAKTLLSRIFDSYHFLEGYALHVEDATYKAGLRKGSKEYRLASLSETLLRNVRLVCSIRLHTDPDASFTVQDAKEMFEKYAFLGGKAAEAEARRGVYDPGYLNYAVGKLLIEELKEKVRLKRGENFKNKEFYDRLLSFGCPPVSVLEPIFLP